MPINTSSSTLKSTSEQHNTLISRCGFKSRTCDFVPKSPIFPDVSLPSKIAENHRIVAEASEASLRRRRWKCAAKQWHPITFISVISIDVRLEQVLLLFVSLQHVRCADEQQQPQIHDTQHGRERVWRMEKLFQKTVGHYQALRLSFQPLTAATVWNRGDGRWAGLLAQALRRQQETQ